MRSHLTGRWHAWKLGLCTVLGLWAASALAQLAQTGAGSKAGGGGAVTCAGALDLSTGCTQLLAFGALF